MTDVVRLLMNLSLSVNVVMIKLGGVDAKESEDENDDGVRMLNTTTVVTMMIRRRRRTRIQRDERPTVLPSSSHSAEAW